MNDTTRQNLGKALGHLLEAERTLSSEHVYSVSESNVLDPLRAKAETARKAVADALVEREAQP